MGSSGLQWATGGSTVTSRASEVQRVDGDQRELLGLLESVLRYARHREYTGWDYTDGMSSRIRRALPFDNRWVNLCFQETAKRAPINVRRLLLIEQRRNFKGTALFAMANLTAARQSRTLDSEAVLLAPDAYEREARELLDWLVEHRRPGYSGFCGGHEHEIQGLNGRGEIEEADVVSTVYPVRALLDGEKLDSRYAEIACTGADFLIEDLNYRAVDGGARIDYYESHPDDCYTINAGALAATLLLDVYDRTGEEDLLFRARQILDHVASLQTDLGGWYYRDPPSSSHLSMDNHHNGFIIECFQRYHDVAEPRYEGTIDRALSFYRDVLFEESGAPNWDEDSAYPRDIHASAQGILVFSYAGEYEFARRILDWTLEHLYAGEGRFYFRKHRFYTKRITLMRWCQAWMAYAISEHIAERYGGGGVGRRIHRDQRTLGI